MRAESVRETRHLTPGQRLRNLRAGKGWTQVQLAVKARVSPNTVAFAERDQRTPLPIQQSRIAKLLGVLPQDIWPDELEEAAS